MEFVIFIVGLLIGIGFMWFKQNNEKIHGIVHVDHESESCAFSITSGQLADRSKKIAVFVINHDAKLSREEQAL